MSKATRTFSLNEDLNERKGQVEVTIVRSRPTSASSDSITKKPSSRPLKILGRIEEQEGIKTAKTINKNTGCPSKFNVASPSSFHSNVQRCESKNRKSDLSKLEEKNHQDVVFSKPSYENLANRKPRPFVELEALHRVLDRLRPDDVESTSAWYSSESCCREIVLRFQNLLSEWSSDRKKVDDFLADDNTLTKCEHCGVIKCVEMLQSKEKKFVVAEQDLAKKTKILATCVERSEIMKKCNEKMIITEQDIEKKAKIPAASVVKPIGKSEVMRNSYPVVPARRTDTINSRGKMPMKINNPATRKIDNKCDKNCKIANQSCEKKEIIRSKESCELEREETSKNIDSTLGYCQKYLEEKNQKRKQKNSHPLMDTVKYLARGNFAAAEDKNSQDAFCHDSKNETTYLKKPCNQGKNSFALHGSRDIDFHQDPNFFYCDRLRLCEDELKIESHVKKGEIKLEKAVPEDRGPISECNDVQLKESGTSTFSSSSAESMIRWWIKPRKNLPDAMPLEMIRNASRETLAAGSSLHKVQSIRNRINEAIQKFSSRSDISLNIQPNLSIDKTHSTIKPAQSIDTIHHRNKNTDPCSSSALSVLSSTLFEQQRLSAETSERFERQILYDRVSSRATNSEDSITAAGSKILLMYRRILESNEEMDWDSFEHLVSALHPTQQELWCDICKAISNEAKRVADETGATTEVCIEINPRQTKLNKQKICSTGNEITFELDMIVQDVQSLLKKNTNSSSPENLAKQKKETFKSD